MNKNDETHVYNNQQWHWSFNSLLHSKFSENYTKKELLSQDHGKTTEYRADFIDQNSASRKMFPKQIQVSHDAFMKKGNPPN